MKPGIYLSAEEILKLKTELPPIKKNLDEIQNPRIKVFTKEALERAPDRFWVDPCSIRMSEDIPNRIFHNPITLTNPGGIINHLVVAVYFAIDALNRRPCFRIDNKAKKIGFRIQIPKSRWKARTISAVLLHDICKNGLPWDEKMHPRHGELAIEFLKELPSFKKLNPYDSWQILKGIEWHMGYFGPLPRNRPHDQLFTEFEQVIQEADYYSTRKFLTSVDIDVPLINYPPKDP